MNTLFLNPNSSADITATLRRHIAACGWPAERWSVLCVDSAPRIIASAAQNETAQRAAAPMLAEARQKFDRVVLMSSLDTGYETARRLFGDRAYGFTRSVLRERERRGQRLQVVTFDPSMTALYRHALASAGADRLVSRWSVIDQAPADVAAGPHAALHRLRDVCRRSADASADPIFVIGAVALELARTLREEGLHEIIDPVADLLAWLGSP